MKITDKGLERILSLGLLKATESAGVFYLYTWESVDYYCGLKVSKECLKVSGVYISLTEAQFNRLPVSHNKASNNPKIKKIAEYFETVVYLKFDEQTKTLKTSEYSGPKSKVTLLQIDMEGPSPFTITKETGKDFHGFFSPTSPCTESLQKASFKTEKLWISASPIFENDKFAGVIAGFSTEKEYGLDVLEVLRTFSPKAA